jgi:hypothetical protein
VEIKPLDLGDDTEVRGYADVWIAAQAVDRPGEPTSSKERVIESLRHANPDFSALLRLVARDGEIVVVSRSF